MYNEDNGELFEDDLEGVNALVNQNAAYEDTMKNKDLYRQDKIRELEGLKDSLLGKKEEEHTSGRGSR